MPPNTKRDPSPGEKKVQLLSPENSSTRRNSETIHSDVIKKPRKEDQISTINFCTISALRSALAPARRGSAVFEEDLKNYDARAGMRIEAILKTQ